MFGFQSLEPDDTVLLYEGKVDSLKGLLGSKDETLAKDLKTLGHKYRKGQDRQNYDSVVDALINKGVTRSALQYEVIAQLIRLRTVKLQRSSLPDSPLLREWRSILTGEVASSFRVDCFVGSGYVKNHELKSLDVPGLLPVIDRVRKNGNDLLIISAGYVPRKLKLRNW